MKLLRKVSRALYKHTHRPGGGEIGRVDERRRAVLQVELSDSEWNAFEYLRRSLTHEEEKELCLGSYPDRNVLYIGYEDTPIAARRLANLLRCFDTEAEG